MSPLLRAKETAEILNKNFNLPIVIEQDLIEVHFGAFTGKSWDTIEKGEHYKGKHRDVEYDYRPEGECAEDVKKRLLVFFCARLKVFIRMKKSYLSRTVE